jgi:3,4-dihydroxy 2-butanone 4-phosphate synthase/GTP cyclohydrolase II
MSFRVPSPETPTPCSSGRLEGSALATTPFRDSLHEDMLARLSGSGLAFLQSLAEHLSAQRRGTSERAFVTLSYSQSLDGSIAVSRSTPCSLSCRKSLEMTHMVRSLHDGVLVGINTILSDDPQLTVRYCEGDDPHPVVLDSRLRFPEGARLLRHGPRKPIIITTPQSAADRVQRLEDKGARVYTVRESEGRVDLGAALRLLHGLDIRSVMVEGGATVINSMLASELVDYCVLTITPKIIGGVKAVESLCQPHNAAPLSIDDCRYHTLDRDLIAYGRLSRR